MEVGLAKSGEGGVAEDERSVGVLELVVGCKESVVGRFRC